MGVTERRKAHRVDAKLAVTVTGGPQTASGKTLNISTNGVYFQSPYFIEPLTKVRLVLEIPDPMYPEAEVSSVKCDGVVVRTDPEVPSPDREHYEVAVFFTFIPPQSRKSLEAYMRKRLSSK